MVGLSRLNRIEPQESARQCGLIKQSPRGESCTDRRRNLHGEWSRIQLHTHQLVHAHEKTRQSMV